MRYPEGELTHGLTASLVTNGIITVLVNKSVYLLIFGCVDLPCCVGFSLVARSGSCSRDVVLRLLIMVASLVAEHRL